MSNLVKRSLSALILAPLAVYIAYTGGYAFLVLVFSMFAIMLYEWINISRKLKHKLLWSSFGFFYLGFACTVLYIMGLEPMRKPFYDLERVPVLMLFVISLVWVNDISSYVFGRLIGGPKLAPKISPNKTWAGAIGGLIGSMILFMIINFNIGFDSGKFSDEAFLVALAAHIIIPVIAQIGDLFESYLKRLAGVKDSGNLIPGHGGLLDRMDGVVLVLNAVALYYFINFMIRYSELATQGVAV